MRLLDAVRSATEYLEAAGIEDAFVDAELLVLHAAGSERLAAYTENPEIGGKLSAKIRRLLRRRATGEPVQYIIGYVDFLGLRINVGKGVLIPRPETELLAREAIKRIRQVRGEGSGVRGPKTGIKGRDKDSSLLTPHSSLKILDLCTGSGCIALAVAREFPDAGVYAVDLSKQALKYARENASLNGIGNVGFLEGSLFGPVKGYRFDLIVSNPPYVRTADLAGLQREIREWEPMDALDGGSEGLDFYRQIFSGARAFLKAGGTVMVELGFGQAEAVEKIIRQSGFSAVEIMKDYAGIDRILKAYENVNSEE
jgi:release factor glutamine methyltransferase